MYFMFFTHIVLLINMKNTFLDRFMQFWVKYYLEIQGLFKDFCHNSRTFQGFMKIQGVFKSSSQIQGLFNTVQTLLKALFHRMQGTVGNVHCPNAWDG